MKQNRKAWKVPILRTESQPKRNIRKEVFHCPDIASVCWELGDEMEADEFDLNSVDRCAEVLPWLFLMSVIENRPKS